MDTPFLTSLGLLYLLCTSDQQKKIVEDHPMNIPTKLGYNWLSDFREENKNVKVYRRWCQQWWRMPSDGNVSHDPL